jgi:hypothetical protein
MAVYTVTGPNGFASAGSVPVGESADVPVTLSQLPVGQGYMLVLSATASDGVIVCEGMTAFDVTDATATLDLVVHLSCAVPSGDVAVEATLNVCPVIDDFSASPLFVYLGGVSNLAMVAHDSDNGPAPLAYSWAANGLKLPGKISPALAFACSSVGMVTITAFASDGDPNPTCASQSSVAVTCE